MKTYTVRVNCACFEDIVVEAKNPLHAAELAEKHFNCQGNSPEVGDVTEGDYLAP